MTDTLRLYRHRDAGFTLPAPADWTVLESPREQVALIASAPDRDDEDFRPNVVVTVDELGADQALEPWQREADELYPKMLEQFRLLDREFVELNGRRMLRRLAHHVGAGGVAVVMEQWSTVRERRGYTLTATASASRLWEVAPLFAAVANGFRFDEAVEDPR